MKNYIFFDFDGTLVNTSKGIFYSIDEAFKELNIDIMPEDQKKKYIGPPLETSFINYNNMSETQAKNTADIFRKHYSKKGTYMHSLYDGIEEMLETLKSNGKTLAVTTSKPEKFARLILESYDLSKYFTVISGAKEDGSANSKKDVMLRAINQLGIVDLEECVLIGDTVNDVNGANEVGVDCIGVLYGFSTAEELLNAGAVALANTPIDVLELID